MYSIGLGVSRNFQYNLHSTYISVGMGHMLGFMLLGLYSWLNGVMLLGWMSFVLLSIGAAVTWVFGVLWLLDLSWEAIAMISLNEQLLLQVGIKWLIISEWFLFLALFSTCLNFSFSVLGLYILLSFPLFNFCSLAVPAANLMILLFSSFPGQCALVFIKLGSLVGTLVSIGQLLLCGWVFITLQFYEFLFSFYSISDLLLGSIFYFTTSIHGFHVVIGCIGWLLILSLGIDSWSWLPNLGTNNDTSFPSFFSGLSLSVFLWSYYWHFVDFIWLIVFLLLVV